jgi:hypothetical protein
MLVSSLVRGRPCSCSCDGLRFLCRWVSVCPLSLSTSIPSLLPKPKPHYIPLQLKHPDMISKSHRAEGPKVPTATLERRRFPLFFASLVYSRGVKMFCCKA